MAESRQNRHLLQKRGFKREEEGRHCSENSQFLLSNSPIRCVLLPGGRNEEESREEARVSLTYSPLLMNAWGNKWSMVTPGRSHAQYLQKKVSGGVYKLYNFLLINMGGEVQQCCCPGRGNNKWIFFCWDDLSGTSATLPISLWSFFDRCLLFSF